MEIGLLKYENATYSQTSLSNDENTRSGRYEMLFVDKLLCRYVIIRGAFQIIVVFRVSIS